MSAVGVWVSALKAWKPQRSKPGVNTQPHVPGTVTVCFFMCAKGPMCREKKSICAELWIQQRSPEYVVHGTESEVKLERLDHSCGLSALLWLQVHTCGRSVPKPEMSQQWTSFVRLVLQLQGTWASGMIPHGHRIAPWGSATCGSTLYLNASAPFRCLFATVLVVYGKREFRFRFMPCQILWIPVFHSHFNTIAGKRSAVIIWSKSEFSQYL